MAGIGRRVNKQDSFERGSARAGRWGIALPAGHAYELLSFNVSAGTRSCGIRDCCAVEWRLRKSAAARC